jgi:hypothetical protein
MSISPWAPRIVACSSYVPGTRQLVSIHPAMAYGGSWKCVAVPVSGRGSFVPARIRTRDPATIRTRGLRGCRDTRRGRDHCLQPYANDGYCAAKDLHSDGCRLSLRISSLGMITQYPLLAAHMTSHTSTPLSKTAAGWRQQIKALLLPTPRR